MQQDDIASIASREGELDDRVDRDALPVFGVIAQPNGVVPFPGGDADRLQLVGRGGRRITEVRRPEERRAVVEHRFEEALVGVELESRTLVRHEGEIGVRIRVIPDLVPLVEHPPRQQNMGIDVLADHEERGRRVPGEERVEDHRRPRPVRTIVEGQCRASDKTSASRGR